MPANETPRRPRERCYNCGLPCNGMFCCDWCLNTYLARRDAHQVARQRRARSQSREGSVPAADQAASGDQRENCGSERPGLPPDADGNDQREG